jgi:hypothetical protein
MQRRRRCREPQRNTIATRTTFAFISVHSRFINRHLPFTTHDFSLRHSKFLVRHSTFDIRHLRVILRAPPTSVPLQPPCPSILRAAVRKKNCISCANLLPPLPEGSFLAIDPPAGETGENRSILIHFANQLPFKGQPLNSPKNPQRESMVPCDSLINRCLVLKCALLEPRPPLPPLITGAHLGT